MNKLSTNKSIVPMMIGAAGKAKIETHPLRRDVSVLEGSGGKIAVLIGEEGKLLIDSEFTVPKPRIEAALDHLSFDPITQLIKTHWHTDHTDGNAWVHEAGAAITAHINTKKHLSVSTLVEGWEWTSLLRPLPLFPTPCSMISIVFIIVIRTSI